MRPVSSSAAPTRSMSPRHETTSSTCCSRIIASSLREFHYQSPPALGPALAVEPGAPLPALLLAAGSGVLGLLLWNRVSRGKKILLVLGVALAAAAAVMVRINYFEWMFHPIPQAGF